MKLRCEISVAAIFYDKNSETFFASGEGEVYTNLEGKYLENI